MAEKSKISMGDVLTYLKDNPDKAMIVVGLLKGLFEKIFKKKEKPVPVPPVILPPSGGLRDNDLDQPDDFPVLPPKADGVGAVAVLDAHLGWIQWPQDWPTEHNQNLYPNDLKRSVERGEDAMNTGSKFKISCTPRDAQGRELKPEDVQRQGLAHRVFYRFTEDGSNEFVWGMPDAAKNGDPEIIEGSPQFISMAGRAYKDTLGYNPRFSAGLWSKDGGSDPAGRHSIEVQPEIWLMGGQVVKGPKLGPWFID